MQTGLHRIPGNFQSKIVNYLISLTVDMDEHQEEHPMNSVKVPKETQSTNSNHCQSPAGPQPFFINKLAA